MNTQLSDQQKRDYKTNGCLVFRDFLSSAEVDALLEAVSEALVTMGSKRVVGESVLNESTSEKNDYYNGVFLQKLNLWKITETVKRIFLGP